MDAHGIEEEVKKYKEKIDEMKKLILKYGLFPILMYVGDKGKEEEMIFLSAYVELKSEGKIN